MEAENMQNEMEEQQNQVKDYEEYLMKNLLPYEAKKNTASIDQDLLRKYIIYARKHI